MADCNHDCSSCGASCSDRTAESLIAKTNEYSNVKKVIGIVSGKGGVGKSLVTSLMASEMQKRGFKAAVLDADVTGPSIPKVFGITEKCYAIGDNIIPGKSAKGTKVMSINLMLDNDTDPVVWRGPVIAGVIKQFWSDVVWEDIDFMFVDMPPGTGDVPLTVFQSLPVDGIIVVTSPQDLVSMIVGKAVKMAELMNIPILGLVENMAYFECPNCNEKHYIFGKSNVEELAKQYNIDTVAQIPMNPELAKHCDAGKIEEFDNDYLKAMADKIQK